MWEHFVPKTLFSVKVLCNNPFMEKQFTTQNSAQRWLVAEFKRRKANNQLYSLRAFAKTLDLPPGRLSEIFAGKRGITEALANRIADRMGLSPNQRKVLYPQPKKPKELELPAKDPAEYELLSEDEFETISDWYNFAFLNLIETEGFRSNISWIAKRLGISSAEVRDMLSRMHRLGLIEIKGKVIRKTQKDFRTTTDVPSAALRNFHNQALDQAKSALNEMAVEERDITSILFPADPDQLPEAKKLIQEFRYKMDRFFEKSRCTEVYRLNIQLLPVTKREKK